MERAAPKLGTSTISAQAWGSPHTMPYSYYNQFKQNKIIHPVAPSFSPADSLFKLLDIHELGRGQYSGTGPSRAALECHSYPTIKLTEDFHLSLLNRNLNFRLLEFPQIHV